VIVSDEKSGDVEIIEAKFSSLVDILSLAREEMSPAILRAAQVMATAIGSGGKILVCGNGGSAAHAQHLVSELVGRFQQERGGYKAFALTADAAVCTAIANDFGYKNVFSRQVKALGNDADVLVVISTSGNSENIIHAIHAARELKMPVISMTGAKVPHPFLNDKRIFDVWLGVPSLVTARIQEVHQLVIHCLCELIEASIGNNA